MVQFLLILTKSRGKRSEKVAGNAIKWGENHIFVDKICHNDERLGEIV